MENEFNVLLAEYVQESQERLDVIEELLVHFAREGSPETLAEMKRELHTLKGNSGMMGLARLQETAHRLEERVPSLIRDDPRLESMLAELDAFRDELRSVGNDPAHSAVDTVRVSFEGVEALVDAATQLIIARNELNLLYERVRIANPSDDDLLALESPMQAIHDLMWGMRKRILSMRLLPLRRIERQLARIVRDEQEREGNRTRFVTEGLDVEVDRSILAGLSDALGHLARNSVIHGIESGEERKRSGKPVFGTLRLEAAIKPHSVEVRLSDDGRGIDADALRAAAAARGFDPASFGNALELMFLPDVSTRGEASLGAGRGIGMSAVLDTVQKLAGTIRVASERGKGTSFVIKLPLDVSIMPALLVVVDGETCAIPAGAVIEVLPFERDDLEHVAGVPFLSWRGELVRAGDLGAIQGSRASIREQGVAAVLRIDSSCGAIITDRVLGMTEIVTRPVDALAPLRRSVSNATILADGTLALVVDPRGLFEIRSGLVM